MLCTCQSGLYLHSLLLIILFKPLSSCSFCEPDPLPHGEVERKNRFVTIHCSVQIFIRITSG